MPDALDDRFESTIEAQLRHGEALLWRGQPRHGLQWRGEDLVKLVPPILIGAVVSLTWWAVSPPMFRAFVPYLAALFLAIPVLGTLGRALVDAFRRGNSWYALTDRRAIILQRGPFGATKSIWLENMPALVTRSRAGNCGTIYFGEPPPSWDPRPTYVSFWDTRTPCFDFIDDVSSVSEAIQSAKARLLGQRA